LSTESLKIFEYVKDRNRAEGNLQEKPVTASDVQGLIKRELQQKEQQQQGQP